MELLGIIIFIAIFKSIFGRLHHRHRHCHFFKGILGGLFLSWIFNRDRNRTSYNDRDWRYNGTNQWY